jgi:hypothetical protein
MNAINDRIHFVNSMRNVAGLELLRLLKRVHDAEFILWTNDLSEEIYCQCFSVRVSLETRPTRDTSALANIEPFCSVKIFARFLLDNPATLGSFFAAFKESLSVDRVVGLISLLLSARGQSVIHQIPLG